jgi:RimJ/RimL family protein N-acetyltransferase
VIETERLLLRPPDECDVEAVYRFVADPDVMRWIGDDGQTGTYADAAARIERYRRAWDLDGFGHFMVVPKVSGEPIGRVGILVWDPRTWEHGTRRELGDAAELELGWTLERAAWGRGFATEAATAVGDWAFRELQPGRLISLIRPDNVRSLRVAQKVGERYRHDVTVNGLTVQLWELASPT